MEYLAIFILLLFYSYKFDYLRHTKNKYIAYYFLLVLFIFLAGFRYRLGVDSIRYEIMYVSNPDLLSLSLEDFKESKFDPLYLILTSLMKLVSNDFWLIQLAQASIVNIIVFSFIRKNTNNVFFGVLLYYVFLYISFMFEVMREACAVSMFLLGWEYLKKDKILYFLFFCVLAFLFHSSACLLLVLPVLKIIKIWKILSLRQRNIFFLIIILLLGYIVQNVFFDYLASINITNRISNKIEAYSENKLSGGLYNIWGILIVIIKYILYPYLAVCLCRRLTSKINLNLEVMVYFCFLFAVMSIPIALFYRYNNYFMPFALIAMSQIVYSKKIYLGKSKLLMTNSFKIWLFIFLPLFFLQIYGYFSNIGTTQYKEYMRYYPYSSIFTKQIDNNREAIFYYYDAF